MVQLEELNSTILKSLRLKYSLLKIFKENNLKKMKFETDFILNGELSECVNFTHELLEVYLKFKDSLNNKNILPGTKKFLANNFYSSDLIYESDLFQGILKALDFQCFNVFKDLTNFENDSSVETESIFNNLGVDPDDPCLNYADEIDFSQIALCHPLLDKLLSTKDGDKIKELTDFLDYNCFDLANFTLPPLSFSCDYAKISIVSVNNLINLDGFKNKNFGEHKYAILIEFLECYYGQEGFDYICCVYAFLSLYSILNKK